ncbi:MAG: hypothetical protein NE328_04910 [Lentisphaeraceae bacterium]|nr:hypothetical protein [Lentisphaeraceae bacterium]
MAKQIHYLLFICGLIFVGACSKDSSESSLDMGALNQVIQEGESDGWLISKKTGKLWLQNKLDSNAIRYYYAPTPSGNGSERSASVSVNLNKASTTGKAGLLYGYDTSSKNYWLIVINAQGVLEVYRRDEMGVAMRSSQTVSSTANGEYKIEIHESGHLLSIKVNGNASGSIESDSIGRGAFGIAAFSSGEFAFNNFKQSASGNTDGIKQDLPRPSIVNNVEPKNNINESLPKPNTVSNPQSKNKVNGNAVEFSEETIRDEGRQNFPAYTILVPKGWELKGFVKAPNPSLFNIPHFSDIIIKAPDGRFVHYYPFMEFGYNDQAKGVPMKQAFDGRFYMRMPKSLGQFWTYLVSLSPNEPISNIQIVSEEVLKDATQYVQKIAQEQYQQANIYNQQSSIDQTRFVFDIQVRRLIVRYHYEGKEYEEVIFATWGHSTVWHPNGTVKAAMWNLNNMYSIGGAPGSGFLDDPVLATVVRSRKVNKDWAYAIDGFYKNRRGIIIKQGMAAIAASKNSWKNTAVSQSEDVLDISFKGWKKRNGMNDAGHSNSVNGVHERTTYSTPSGSQVNLPSYYQQVYTDGQGNYILHNDANYQINSDSNFNQRSWQQIQPVR